MFSLWFSEALEPSGTTPPYPTSCSRSPQGWAPLESSAWEGHAQAFHPMSCCAELGQTPSHAGPQGGGIISLVQMGTLRVPDEVTLSSRAGV